MGMLALAVYILCLVVFVGGLRLISWILGSRWNVRHGSYYFDSGIRAKREKFERHDVKYVPDMMIFLLFMIKIIFLLAWALRFGDGDISPYKLAGLIGIVIISLVSYVCIIMFKKTFFKED